MLVGEGTLWRAACDVDNLPEVAATSEVSQNTVEPKVDSVHEDNALLLRSPQTHLEHALHELFPCPVCIFRNSSNQLMGVGIGLVSDKGIGASQGKLLEKPPQSFIGLNVRRNLNGFITTKRVL